jgi:hypothetical protein
MYTTSTQRMLDHVVESAASGLPSNRGALGEAMQTHLDMAASGAAKVTLPGSFSGWSRSVPLAALLRMKQANQTGGMFFTGSYRLYRIAWKNKRRPLYIGMAGRGGVYRRVCAHYFGSSRQPICPTTRGYSKALHRLIGGKSPDQIRVHVGWIKGVPQRLMDMKLLHAYELYLQHRERPLVYNPNIWTFDDFEELRAENDG